MIRELARSLNVSDKGWKLDIINRIKGVLNIEETFLKLFSKMWGGSGKTCTVLNASVHIKICCKSSCRLMEQQYYC